MKKISIIACVCFLAFNIDLTGNGIYPVTVANAHASSNGAYVTLKAAFDAINLQTQTGFSITISIIGNTTETASASLSDKGWTSLTISPSGGAARTISCNISGNLIVLNEAKNVTIDGLNNGGNSLTISNTSTTAFASTITFINGASNNTITRCTLLGSTGGSNQGVILFSTSTGTTGNNNNTISNNNITHAGSATYTRPYNAIYSLGSNGKLNTGNNITNNNIYDFFKPSAGTNGIRIGFYSTDFTISGNNFYETTEFEPSGSGTYRVIYVNNSLTCNNFTISNNYIGGSAVGCSGTAWSKTNVSETYGNVFIAINIAVASDAASNIQGNTIKNFNWSNQTGDHWYGMYIQSGAVNIGTSSGNTIGAPAGTGSITYTNGASGGCLYGIWIGNNASTVDCQNNTIGSITTAATNPTDATHFRGIYKNNTAGAVIIKNNTIGSTSEANSIHATSSCTGNIQEIYGIISEGTGEVTISENTIANLTNGATGFSDLINGINVTAGTNSITKNTIRDLNIANGNAGSTHLASAVGIVFNSLTEAEQIISGNTIYNISNTKTDCAGTVTGIYYSGSTTVCTVSHNFIHSLSVPSSNGAKIYAIRIAAGTSTYSNNIISLDGNTQTTLFGIYETGAASNNNSLYFNTVYLGGTPTAGALNSYAFYSNQSTNTRNFRNNIFVNARSNSGATGKHYAVFANYTENTNLTINYNDYYVSGTGGVLGGRTTTDYTTISDWRTATGQDAQSISTNPVFSGAGGTTAENYRPTVALAAGVDGTGITVDFNDSSRYIPQTRGAFQNGVIIPDNPSSFNATPFSATQINLGWALNGSSNPVVLAYDTINTFGTPAGAYNAGDTITGGGTVLYAGTDTSFHHSPLIINTHYFYKIWSKNDSNEYSTGVTDNKWTLVNVPSSPTINNPSMTSLDITINENGNPASVEYAIHETTINKFIQSDGKPGVSPFWQTAALWGTKTVTELDTNTTYVFEVKARNGGFTETAYGDTVSASTLKCYMGEAWTGRAMPAGVWIQPMAVTFGNNKFVAVGDNSEEALTSPDGITWTANTIPLACRSSRWVSVIYGNGLFVAVAGSGTNRVMTSPDGITWTARDAVQQNEWVSVTYGNGKFVAVSRDGTNQVMTSTDGTTWTARNAAEATYWSSVIYANNKFVAVAGDGTKRVMTSPDGITWTSQTTTGNTNQWRSVTYGNEKFVAVANVGTNRAMTSPDGITWTNQTAPAGPWYSVTYGNGLFVAVGAYAVSVTQKVMTSPDGVDWTARSSANDASWWRSIVYANGMFVAVANSGTKIMTSDCSPVLTVTTEDASAIATTSASGNGTIALAGVTPPTDRGIIFYPYTDTDKIIGGTNVTNVHEAGTFSAGAFTATLTNLSVNARYNARAHATDTSNGITYGSRVNFWTLANVPGAPTVNNPTATTLNVAVSPNSNPSTTQFAIFDTVTDYYVQTNGSLGATPFWQTSTGWGTKTVTGLTVGTVYVFKVKARNGGNVETAFGATASGTPLDLPVLTTDATTNITTNSATGNGDITDIGAASPTNRGIIWYPYSNTDKIIGGTDVVNIDETGVYDTGAYALSLTGLSVNTRYNARAHATNTDGTGYGTRVDFWTLANTPGTPSVKNPRTTSLDVRIDANSNPASTLLAIQETSTGKWVRTSGTLGDTAIWQTESQWEVNDSARAKTVTGLSANTIYKFCVKAKNGGGIETSLSSPDSLFTLANTPSAPTVNLPTTTSLNVAINVNGNPAITQFAIRDTVSGQYVQLDGALGATAVWQTESQWETAASNTAITVTGLNPNSRYTFEVKACNGDLAETAFSGVTSLFTLANIPSPPHVFNPTASTLDISIDPNGNPAHTLFCIQDSVNNSYVQPNGTRSGSVAWQTAATWDTTTVTGLSIGGTYYFRVKGKNGNDVETVYGLTTAGTTCLNPVTGGVIGTAQTICYNTTPAALTETTAPTGYAGTLEYQWQSSATGDSLSFVDITGATETGYAPGQLTDTTWYLRLVKVTCKADWIRSNILKINVYPDFDAGSIETTGDTICYNGDPTLIGSATDASGGDNSIYYQWQQMAGVTDAPSWTNVTGATNATYDPPALTSSTTYRRQARDGTCNTTFTSSTGVWGVTVRPEFTTGAIATTGENICYGTDPATTIGNTTLGSGGDNAITYSWRSSADSYATEISGATGSTYLPAGPLTETTSYRRYVNDGTCNTTPTVSTGTWTVTVSPLSAGGAVTGGTDVCYGTNSTLLTLSGHTGTVVKWQYSTDNSNWTDISSHTQTTYTAENLTVDTWYQAVVASSPCSAINSDATQINIITGMTISGYAKYENNPKSPLNGLKITLKKDGTPFGSPVITGNNGYYEFTGLEQGNYGIEVSSAHPSGQWQTWGGVTNTDYLLVSKHIAGTQNLPVNPPVVQVTASTKLPHPAINNLDATAIRQAVKFPMTGYTYFDIPKWVFSGMDAATGLDDITVVCTDVVRDIRGLCAGDVNGTYVPPTGNKIAVQTHGRASLQLMHRGTLPLTDEIVFPIRVDRDMELGAITLYLDFDPSVMTVTNVTLPGNSGAELWFNVQSLKFNVEDPTLNLKSETLNLKPETLNTLAIGWMSLDPVPVAAGQAVILVHARLRNAVETLHATSLPLANPIRFTLNENPLSELANGEGEIIEGAILEMPEARVNTTETSEEFILSVFPNPSNQIVNVDYLLTSKELVSFVLTNSQGVEVLKTDRSVKSTGTHRESFDVSGLMPGVYMLKATAGTSVSFRKVVVVR